MILTNETKYLIDKDIKTWGKRYYFKLDTEQEKELFLSFFESYNLQSIKSLEHIYDIVKNSDNRYTYYWRWAYGEFVGTGILSMVQDKQKKSTLDFLNYISRFFPNTDDSTKELNIIFNL